jgi:hypothetical protein
MKPIMSLFKELMTFTGAVVWIIIALVVVVLKLGGNTSPIETANAHLLNHDMLNHDRETYVILATTLQRIAAGPGDTVRLTREGSYINGKLWPNSAVEKARQHFPFGTYVLPTGMFWLLCDNPAGLDSRINGPVPQALIIGTPKPVLTEQPQHQTTEAHQGPLA